MASTSEETGIEGSRMPRLPTSKMVLDAITGMKERRGSSLHAIKKYITDKYETDSDKLAPYVKKYLKSAVDSGVIIQTKGTGANGSFKISANFKKAGMSSSSTKTTQTKKEATTSKKPATLVETELQAAETSSKQEKLKSKEKKASNLPTEKPKSPKPKKATTKNSELPKKAAVKKAAPKKN